MRKEPSSSEDCVKGGLKKGQWTSDEDQKLMEHIQKYGHGSWRDLPAKAGLRRCGKSCRLRWTNYLRPDIKRGQFSTQEQRIIIQLHALLGNRWSVIATHLPKRTDNEIKNHWNTSLKRKLAKMGLDPVTHKPNTGFLSPGQLKDAANIRHMAQWEAARLEAEARLARKSIPQLFDPFQTRFGSSFLLQNSVFTSPGNVVSTLEKGYFHSKLSNKMRNANEVIQAEQIMHLPENEYFVDVANNVARKNSILIPGILEGCSDIFLDNGTNGSRRVAENNTSWDSILGSLDSLPFDIPIF